MSTSFDDLEYTNKAGKTVMLSGDSRDACTKDCKDCPDLQDAKVMGAEGNEKLGGLSMDKATHMVRGGEKGGLADCIRFCQAEFEIFCFPGDSKVVVQGRGRIPIAQLRIGDSVLAVRPAASASDETDQISKQATAASASAASWELHYDTVLAWIHRDPDAEDEVLQLRHEHGQVHLTADHLIYAQRHGSSTVSLIIASDVEVGDRLLAPWIDGTLVTPEVQAIKRVHKRGMYTPFVGCGTVLVDNTAASCFAIPRNFTSSPLYSRFLQQLSKAADGDGLHLFLNTLSAPLRLHLQGALSKSLAAPATKEELPKPSSEDESACRIHPYFMALYVGATLIPH